ncbi:nitric oxide-sensing protein NosP [Vreelandella aquamarina]
MTSLFPGSVVSRPPANGIITAASDYHDATLAVAQLGTEMKHVSLGGVLFFCSAEYDLEALGAALSDAFADIPVCGCTTAGEITPSGYGRGCIVAIGFDRRVFSMVPALVDDLVGFDLPRAQQLVDSLLARCRPQAVAPLNEHSFVMTLLDGLSSREEQVLATLDAALGRIPSFGGSAGDDNHLTHTHVFAEGAFHTQAAVMLMINTRLPFDVFSTHHLTPRAEKFVVTAADREKRRVMELNGAPAAVLYAQWVGVPVESLTSELFARYPLAVRLGEQHFVRSIQRANPDGSLSFYCAVENGIVLSAMRPSPLLVDLEGMLAGVTERLGPPALVIGCDCFLRRMELESLGQLAPASALLKQAQVVGFNTYGEQHHGMHVNQTFTGVAFGALPT